MTEAELISAALAGDEDAKSEIYSQNLGCVRAVGAKLPQMEIDDFCQTVFLKVFASLGLFRKESKLSTWITRIAKNEVAATYLRRKQAKNGDDNLEARSLDVSEELWENESFAVEDWNLRAVPNKTDLALLMQVLSPENRNLVQQYHIEGEPECDVAGRAGLSLPAFRSRLHRSMMRLRKKAHSERIDLTSKSL